MSQLGCRPAGLLDLLAVPHAALVASDHILHLSPRHWTHIGAAHPVALKRDSIGVYMYPVIQQVHTAHPRPRRLAPTLQPNQDRWFDSSSPRLRYPALEHSAAESTD